MRGKHQISQVRGICPCPISRRYQKFGFMSTSDKIELCENSFHSLVVAE